MAMKYKEIIKNKRLTDFKELKEEVIRHSRFVPKKDEEDNSKDKQNH